MIATNLVDFTKSPFVDPPAWRANGRVKYVAGHNSNRDKLPVITFPRGLCEPGDVVEVNVKQDKRFTKNGLRFPEHRLGDDGQLQNELYGERSIIRIVPVSFVPEKGYELVLVPVPQGHTGGVNGGNWDTTVEDAVKVWRWANHCSGRKWWQWFTLAIQTADKPIRVHQAGSTAKAVIDRTWVNEGLYAAHD